MLRGIVEFSSWEQKLIRLCFARAVNDRQGRKVTGLTALDPRENNFELMYQQVKAMKEGKSISKPIYNHVNGTLDENETIEPTPIVIFEGLHPFHDPRVEALMDFKIYVDITPEVKFNWKVQRDHEERGHSIESIKVRMIQVPFSEL